MVAVRVGRKNILRQTLSNESVAVWRYQGMDIGGLPCKVMKKNNQHGRQNQNELKTNFLGTCLDGAILTDAVCIHSGRTTQVWDASVTVESTGKKIAVFRCTQVILYKR